MATLINHDTQQILYLYAHHTFGRLVHSVDTVIELPQISKFHAAIEWHNNDWHLRDLSRNGTWVNQAKLTQNNRTRLKIGDKISFADAKNVAYIVKDLAPPQDMLVCVENELDTIPLLPYQLLPEQNPQVAIYFNQNHQQWHVEQIAQTSHMVTDLKEHGQINFANKSWRLHKSHLANETIAINQDFHLEQVEFVFHLSPDEEQTELQVNDKHKTIDFYTRSHHYLSLNLARQKAKDAHNNLPLEQQGWIYVEQLEKDLGLDTTHINIQVHRIRKQFSDLAADIGDPQQLIERKLGKLRFGANQFKIYKAGKLETQLNQNELN